ncbi:MAG TPA: tRNA pseudouridine(55) synthase TruB [Longimicrobiales bacterium]|nr:tRNA pseudouridine(55) synthase TruB [Longimicrobiales bacterium]
MAGADAPIEGVLPIDKPAGPTSHDMVSRSRRALGTRRIGHTGTLDPFASGLLLLCVGRATRIAEYLSGMDKRYRAVVQLGVSTDTEDATGTAIEQHDPSGITREAVDLALDAQRGSILQTPPAYSAKKVGGERSYALARQGRAVALEPVPVTIHGLVVTSFALPEVHLDVTCSSGTYIRSIARDLGAALGVGAHLSGLRRMAVGPHSVDEALPAEALHVASDATRIPSDLIRDAMIPTLVALGAMPRIDLTDDDLAHIRHGRGIASSTHATGTVALAAHGELVAIADAAEGRIRPRKVFL